MKTVLAVMISLSLCVGASAQKRIGGFSHPYIAQRVVVVPSVGFGYGYGYPAMGLGFGYPFFGYPYFGYPYPAYGYDKAAAQLSYKIQSIRADYQAQIREVRHNKSVSRTERRAQIHNLRNELDGAIIAAQEGFRSGKMNPQNQKDQNNGKDDSINPSSDTHS